MTRRRVWMSIGTAAAAILILAGAIYAWQATADTGKNQADADGKLPAASVRVDTVRPKPGGVERTLTRPATIHSFQYADLFAKVTGYLRDQKVDIGDTVKKDQSLATIFAPEIEANVQKAQADLLKSRAQVKVMEARISAAEADLKEANVKVKQAETDLDTAIAMLNLRKQQYQRFKSLAESKSIEQELADEKFEALKASEASERSTRQSILSAKAAAVSSQEHVIGAEADLADAKAQVQVADANLSRAKVFQDYTTIRAPFDGVITRRTFHDGDFILEGSSTGNKPLLSVAVKDLMRVVVEVPAPDVPFTHRGVLGDVRIDTLPGKKFQGKIARTSMSEDYNSRTMRAEIDLPNPDDVLTNGMFCSVTLHLGANANAVTIPSASLIGGEQNDQRFVYVIKHGKAHRTAVHVGLDDGIHAEILSGLSTGDEVIDGHGSGLADGVGVVVGEKGND
jgi:HlyD family secretion protein